MQDRKLTNFVKFLLRIWNTGWFAFIWLWFYNNYMFDTWRRLGAAVSILLFCVLYNGCCQMYKAFSIVSTETTEAVVSHAISLFLADIVPLTQVILISDTFRVQMFNLHFVNILPGFLIYLLQVLGSTVIIVFYKQYYSRHVAPSRTVLVYGADHTEEEARQFEQRLLRKYRHLFSFEWTLKHDDPGIRQVFDECETVIMYDLETLRRSELIGFCLKKSLPFYYTAGIPAIVNMGCEPKHLLDTPLMKYEYPTHGSGRKRLKNVLDRLLAAVLLVLLSPVILLTALYTAFTVEGPVLERDERYTVDERIFRMLRFRTPEREDGSKGIAEKLHLDELPQLINILLGDMSFVGPRPERVSYVDARCRELPEFRYRMSVKGGLTGYAQVFGTEETSTEDRLKMDLLYIENQSLALDLRLLMLTVRAFIR